MATVWIPDFCPAGGHCEIETDSDQSSLVRFARRCPHHQAMRNMGDTDEQIFDEIRTLSSAKEQARAAVALELGLDGNREVPYRVESNGRIVIETWAAGADGTKHNILRAAAFNAIAADARGKRAPVSKIEVE